MSVIFSHHDGWMLCHSSYLHQLYMSIQDEEVCACGKYEVFHVGSPFLRDSHKKHSNPVLTVDETKAVLLPDEQTVMKDCPFSTDIDEVMHVKLAFSRLIDDAKRQILPYFDKCILTQSNNQLAMKAADEILKSTDSLKSHDFHGGNHNNYSISVTLGEVNYFIPPLCRFYCCSVHKLPEKLANQDVNQFDVILLDPPWWNKHVRRKNARDPSTGYKMMFDEHLMKIPIDSLLTPDGLVVVWCTNSKQHKNCLVNEIFPVWKISYVTSWYWVKITGDGIPICPFSNNTKKKQPFERIIFGSRLGRSDKLKNPDSHKLIVSIPSAIHSHKPPLTDILSEYISPGSLCIELFARYLTPNWTSCGNEVLKLQQKNLFKKSRDIG